MDERERREGRSGERAQKAHVTSFGELRHGGQGDDPRRDRGHPGRMTRRYGKPVHTGCRQESNEDQEIVQVGARVGRNADGQGAD